MSEEWITMHANMTEEEGRVVLSTEEGKGSFSMAREDVRENDEKIEIRVGSKVKILEQPKVDERPPEEKKAASSFKTACIGANQPQHIPGVLIRCDTGKVIGRCWISYPC